MSPERLPEAVLLDPGSGALPEGLEPLPGDAPSPILLLVAPDTGDASVRTAVALAEGRARAGHDTVLADASVREPRLHEFLDVENAEGLSDILLYGVSPDRVRVRPPARPFDFIPVGPYLPDDAHVLNTERWTGIAAGFEREDATLLLFVTAGTAGLDALSGRFGRVVLIGDPASVQRGAASLDPFCEVVAVIEPATALDPARLAAVAGAPEDAEAETIFDRPDRDAEVFRGTPKERRAVSPVLWFLLAATVVFAAWYAYTEYFAGSSPSPEPSAAPDSAVEVMDDTAVATPVTAPDPARGDPVDVVLPISIAVEAHQDFSAASERVSALRAAEPDIAFFLAPIDLDGVVYYRLLAGPVEDRVAGERLMARLVQAGHKTASDPWAIRNTPHAFLLGDYDTQAAALARVDFLAARQIPGYVIAVPYDTGPPRYRVYGGAYETEGEAVLMRARLGQAGVEAELVTRTGRPVGGP